MIRITSVLVLAFTALNLFGIGSDAAQIKVYEHEGLNGVSLPIDLLENQCHNIQQNWVNEVSSVDIKDACIVLFADKNCDRGNGKGIRLDTQKDRGTEKLAQIDFNDQAASVRLC